MREPVLLIDLLPHEKERVLQELLDRLGYHIYLTTDRKERKVDLAIDRSTDSGTR